MDVLIIDVLFLLGDELVEVHSEAPGFALCAIVSEVLAVVVATEKVLRQDVLI